MGFRDMDTASIQEIMGTMEQRPSEDYVLTYRCYEEQQDNLRVLEGYWNC